ncbi:cyanate permease [Hoeflea halophila]|uniref:Cyanate permease n=1 Tax=Hoeflea halophila TaxID=714899 RepID=A0A286IHX5_9HYPH|nr:MFS transporter [Hoeflea halophila]SOE18974.1 cyanate permease [Hoeflea halophila]
MGSRSTSTIAKALPPYVAAHGAAQLLLWSAFYYLLPALMSQIADQTNWPVVHLSTTFSVVFLAWAASAPFAGWLVDRGYGHAMMRAGGLLGALLLVVLTQLTDRWLFSGLFVLLGCCMAATLYDPCFALILRRMKDKAANGVATVTLIAGFATLLTFPAVSILSSFLSWQEVMLVFAAGAAAGVVLLPKEPHAVEEQRVVAVGKLDFGAGPRLIAVSFGMTMLGHAILLFMLPVIVGGADQGSSAALLALSILGPAQVAGRLIWRAYGGHTVTAFAAKILFGLFCLPPLLLLLFGLSNWLLYAVLLLQGGCYGIHTILRPLLAARHLPSSQIGRGLGVIATVGLVMMALGPALGGLIWSGTGTQGLLTAVLLVNLVGLALVFVLFHRTPEKKAACSTM